MPESKSSSVHPCLPEALLQSFQTDSVISENPSKIYWDEFNSKFRLKALSGRGSFEAGLVFPDNHPDRTLRNFYRFFRPEPEHLDRFWEGDKRTFLHLAACEGDVPLAYECIRMGVAVDWKDRFGCSALLLGCYAVRRLEAAKRAAQTTRKGRSRKQEGKIMNKDVIARRIERTLRIIKLLIEQHADVNVKVDGESPFIIVSDPPNWTLIRLFVQHKVDVPPSFLSSPILRSPANETRFRNILEQAAGEGSLRPPRPCPCWSGKMLSECHAAGSQPYPSEFLCRCGTKKLYGNCCAKKQFTLMEEWDDGDQWIRPSQVRPMVLPPYMTPDEFAASRLGVEGTLAMFGHLLPTSGKGLMKEIIRVLEKSLGPNNGMDPAFRYAMQHNDFFARPWLGRISKVECKKRMDEWNRAVDKYIASGVDPRPRFDIELESKIGMNGGPLYKSCEADNCNNAEGRDVDKMKCCGSCKLIFYCSQECQTSHWKQHRSDCKAKSHREQQSTSQLLIEEIVGQQTKDLAQGTQAFLSKEFF